MWRVLSAEAGIDLAEELYEHGLAKLTDSSDDHQGNTGGNEAIFDRRGAARVPQKAGYSRSRSIGIRGKSAGGMGQAGSSRTRTHFTAACSRAAGVPLHRRHR